MASENSLIIRNAQARSRIDAAIQNIEAAGVAFEKRFVTPHDKAVAQAQQLENFAAAFEAVAKHLMKPAATKKDTG